MQDTIIPIEEKESVFKLIQVLIEASDSSAPSPLDSPQAVPLTQEIISKHSLMTLVKQQAAELDALRKLSLNLTSSLDLQTVLDAVVSEAMHLVKNARTVHIFLYTRGKLQFGAALNAEGVRNMPLSMPRKNGLTYTVATTGQILVVDDMSTHELYRDAPSSWLGSIVGIPLKINNNVVGVMNLSKSTRGGFRPAELRLLGLLADQAAVAISNANLHKIVTEQANSDIVTGLPNRRALDECLEEEARFAQKNNSQFTVIMMDLDGFKAVNDTYGHAVGDEVLRSVFNYLAGGMRATDFLARYGGDELTLILRQTDLPTARTVTDKILSMMREYSFVLSTGQQIHLGVSGGIAVFPMHSRNGFDLLRAADTALYEAKKHRRGGFVVAREMTGPLTPPENLDGPLS
ncbi:MAG: sensor domain-containing diguanylate cyclase [Chloroflexota bacterium]